MKKRLLGILFLAALLPSAKAQAQRDTVEFDFYEATLGFKSPQELAAGFFNAALKKRRR